MKKPWQSLHKILKLNSNGVGHHVLIAVLLITTFAGFGAYRVFQSSAQTAPQLDSQGRKANGCKPGKIKNEAQNCVKYNQIQNIREDCDKYNLQYDASNESCKDACKAGFYMKEGNCVQFNEDSKVAECRAAGRNYDSATKDCSTTCRDGFTQQGAKCVQNQQSSGGGSSSGGNSGSGGSSGTISGTPSKKDECARQFLQYDAAANKCKEGCIQGYYKKDGKCLELKNQSENGSSNSNSGNSQSGGADSFEGEESAGLDSDSAAVVICETPEQLATAGCAAQQNPSDTGRPAEEIPETATPDGFKVVVYTEKDFKGKSEEFTSEQAKLPRSLNDKIVSIKILKGRWQFCEDADFQKNCTKRWASAADLSAGNGKLVKKISSFRPVTTTVFEDVTETVEAQCKDANGATIAPNEDKTCPENATLQCSQGLELVDGACKEPVVKADVVVPVDKSFKGKSGKEQCELLGRQWIGEVKGKTINGGEYGCSLMTCRLEIDGAPKLNKGRAYCVSNKYDAAYATDTIGEKQCKELHRIWVNQVKLCAQVPNQKAKDQTKYNAEQCEKDYSVYYIYKTKDQEDECFKPGFFQRERSAATSVGGSVGTALQQGPKLFCNTVKRGNYHWDGKKCVIDRKKCWNGDSIPVTGTCPAKPAPDQSSGGGSGDGGDDETDPNCKETNTCKPPKTDPCKYADDCRDPSKPTDPCRYVDDCRDPSQPPYNPPGDFDCTISIQCNRP